MKKNARDKLKDRRTAAKQSDRRCDVKGCDRRTYDLTALCSKHLRARQRTSHPKVARGLPRSAWTKGGNTSALALSQQWLELNPPPSPILQAVQQILSPGTASGLLRDELEWHRNERSAYRERSGGVKVDYSPLGRLTTLLAVTVYCLEREREFPGDTLEIFRALALLRMRQRPPLFRGERIKTKDINTTARRELAHRINVGCGPYLTEAANLILAARAEAAAQMFKDTPITEPKDPEAERQQYPERFELFQPRKLMTDGPATGFYLPDGPPYWRRKPATRPEKSAALRKPRESFTEYLNNYLNHNPSYVNGRRWVGPRV